MLTRQEGERLAQSINAIRPDWPVSSLLTLIGKRKERALMDLALELMYVALDPDTKSPARIDADGPWKRLNRSAVAGPQYKAITDADCAICSRPEQMHPLSATDPHTWEPQHARVDSHRPTPEQRAAINAANVAAQIKVTAEKEAKAAKEIADVDTVLARHDRAALDAIANHQTTTEGATT